ncbi:MAG: SCP2 sterol-binding domain-containing protein [Syntrophaceae bacterium]|jgi:putative sterol carrier protein
MSIAFASVKEVFEKMPEAFQSSAASGVDVVFQFKISGPGGGDWNVAVKGGACTVSSGTAASPSCTLALADADFMGLMSGKLSGMQAYMTGKLKVSGDLMKSQLLSKLFKF